MTVLIKRGRIALGIAPLVLMLCLTGCNKLNEIENPYCPPGSRGCPCLPDAGCNAELVCALDACQTTIGSDTGTDADSDTGSAIDVGTDDATDTNTDADTDTRLDTDSDTAAVADTADESEVDTSTDTGHEADTGTVSGVDTGSDTGDSDSVTATEADSATYSDIMLDTEPATDTGTAGDTNADAGADAGADAAVADTDAGTDALLASLVPRLDALANATADWWLSHGVDEENGGFYGTLDRQGSPSTPTDKGLIQQARHLFAFSAWYERRSPTDDVKSVIDSTYAFITEQMKDGDLFNYKVDATGATVIDDAKQYYANGFAIYSLSTYGRIFGLQEAEDLALAAFRAIDARGHDDLYGGYDETTDENALIQAGSAKGTNTHIHLMEAFTALFDVTRDETVGARLNELVDLIVAQLRRPEGYVHMEFERDWTPVGRPRVSYGHDIETTWLLMDAARALGRDQEPAIIDAAVTIGRQSAQHGFDETNGGFYYEGVPNDAPTDTAKVWWTQCEALSGLWRLYYLTHDISYLDRFERTLTWIENSWDDNGGEWLWALSADGSRATNSAKASEWKASYHNLRAFLFNADWISAYLSPTGSIFSGRVPGP